MKRNIIFYIIITVIACSLISCGNKNKKAENLEDLKKKYGKFDFKNCNDYIGALNETIDLYFVEIDKIMTNDLQVEDDALDLEVFLFELFEHSSEFVDECPEKMEEFETDFEKRLLEKFESYGIINDYNYDDLEYYDDEYIFDDEDNSVIIEDTEEEEIILE